MNTMKGVEIICKKYNIDLINVTEFFHYFNGCYQKVSLFLAVEKSNQSKIHAMPGLELSII